MGAFYVNCRVENHVNREESAGTRLLVDSGSECTWIAERTLEKLGIVPEKEITFTMADGRTITRKVGFAILWISKRFTTDEVVFAQKGDLKLLGARTLEGLNLVVDARQKKLVAGGPMPAAGGAATGRASPAGAHSRPSGHVKTRGLDEDGKPAAAAAGVQEWT